jgi:surface antigen
MQHLDMRTWVVAIGLAIAVSGCADVNNKGAGTVLGGALGGLVGSTIGGGDGRVAAAVAGALVGAYVGSNIGESMDELDRLRASRALEQSPTGTPVAWTNPDSGRRYQVTPTRTYYTDSETPCRQYITEAWIEGKRETLKGNACRQADGSWRAQ